MRGDEDPGHARGDLSRAGARPRGPDTESTAQRRDDGIGPHQKAAEVKRDFNAFRLKVIGGLLEQGWSKAEVVNLTELSPLEVSRSAKMLEAAKKLEPTIIDVEPFVEEDIAF